RKRVSDQSIVIDALWLIVCVQAATFMANDEAFWLISGPVAFAAYKIITTVGFKAVHLRTTSGNSDAPRLALLRVFTLGKRAERLVEALATHWRYVGSIQLIAGPDLARVTIQPHEILDFLQGRLARRFITDPSSLERRLYEMDPKQDPDWRYRINDFFCT